MWVAMGEERETRRGREEEAARQAENASGFAVDYYRNQPPRNFLALIGRNGGGWGHVRWNSYVTSMCIT